MNNGNYHYNSTVLSHIASPQNVGVIEDADFIGKGTNPSCGDEVELYIKTEGEVIVDAKIKILGCGAITASMSLLTNLLMGESIYNARKISSENIEGSLGGLPKHKRHCSKLAYRVLQNALNKSKKD
ncbi:MAG: iron-sulfur cluster assembly scaffold protein [Nitrospinota bacterium]|nr:iron-sulfur cluster assembly scaffold protein [Nitrospinota bacterium]